MNGIVWVSIADGGLVVKASVVTVRLNSVEDLVCSNCEVMAERVLGAHLYS